MRTSPSIRPLHADDVDAAWDGALRLWGVQLALPEFLPGEGAKVGSFAWFGFPPRVHIDPAMLAGLGLASHIETVFAHEIGHHVLSPATRINALKIRHQMARALVASGVFEFEKPAAVLSNLWSDLLINTRIHSMQAELIAQGRVTEGGQASGAESPSPGIVNTWRILRKDPQPRLMWVYLRASELLWRLPPNSICSLVAVPAPPPPPAYHANVNDLTGVAEKFRAQEKALREAANARAELQAQLKAASAPRPVVDAEAVAHLARTFAHDPVGGALGFGVILAPYVVEEVERAGQKDESSRKHGKGSAGGEPAPGMGCTEDSAPATAAELRKVLADGRMWEQSQTPGVPGAGDTKGAERQAGGQGLGLAQTLALYPGVEANAATLAWYLSQARRHVRPWSTVRKDKRSPDLPGPLEQWEPGEDLADLDWSGTLQSSPVIVPGVTTKRRAYLDDDPTSRRTSITLDLYIDSSGSMPQPHAGSPAVLAGAILCLSILKGGGSVRVTSFSSPGQVAGSRDFLTKSDAVMRDLLQYFAGGTTFPLDLYRDRYRGLGAPKDGDARHVVVLSDDGLVSMFGAGQPGFETVAADVRRVLTTGTLVLLDWRKSVDAVAKAAGYSVIYLESMNDAPAACASLAKVLRD